MLGKLETLSKILGALLMPFVLFYLGHVYTERDKARADQERRLAMEREAQQG
jgi:cbb3-type cytochrome oxidase subunit 3